MRLHNRTEAFWENTPFLLTLLFKHLHQGRIHLLLQKFAPLDGRLGLCLDSRTFLVRDLEGEVFEVLDALVSILLRINQHQSTFLFHLDDFVLLLVHLRKHFLVLRVYNLILRPQVGYFSQLVLDLVAVHVLGGVFGNDQLVLQRCNLRLQILNDAAQLILMHRVFLFLLLAPPDFFF